MDWYKAKNRTKYMPSVTDCMDWLQGHYPQAFELVAEHDGIVSQGAKNIRRSLIGPENVDRRSELYASYNKRLLEARRYAKSSK